MSSMLILGAGAVGRRAARAVVETDGLERLLVADRDPRRAAEVASAIGSPAEAVDWSPAEPLPAGLSAVLVAAEGSVERAVAERALDHRVPVACSSDDQEVVRSLLDLDDAAQEAGTTVAAGCGLAPGLSDVLARHAVDALETSTEVHVARAGWSGPTCAGTLRRARKGMVLEWRDGAWVRERAGSGRKLVWFPHPVNGLDCRRAASAQTHLLVDALPKLSRASMRMAHHQLDEDHRRRGRRQVTDSEGGWGAAWVEVRGRRGRGEEILVYGVVDRMGFAAGTVLGVTGAWLAGLCESPVTQIGAHGLGALVEPVPFLAELSRRGVKAAAFEPGR